MTITRSTSKDKFAENLRYLTTVAFGTVVQHTFIAEGFTVGTWLRYVRVESNQSDI